MISLAGAVGAVALMVVLVLSLVPPIDRAGLAPTDSASPPASPPTSAQPTADQTTTASHQPSLAPTAAPDPIVRHGDDVVGAGYVARLADGGLRLCGWGPVRARGGVLQCAQPSVEVVVESPEVLPGWAPQEDGAASDWLQVRGRWLDGALHVDRFVTAERPETFPRRAPPCDPPRGGWPGNATDSNVAEEAGLALQGVVDADPSLYSGIGITFPRSDMSDAVLVVGTVGEVDTVSRDLAAIYPYNLCVVGVDYSRADLEPVQRRLLGSGWTANVDEINGRVEAWLPLLDPAAAAVIGEDADKVGIRPLLEKVARP